MGDRSVEHADPVTQAGFTMIPNAVMLRADLSTTARLVYGYLKYLAWKNGSADAAPPLLTVCGDLGVSEDTARKAIRSLTGAGLIESKRRGLGLPNAYVIHDPRPENPTDGTRQSRVQEPDNPGFPPCSKELELQKVGANAPTRADPKSAPPRTVKIDGRNLGFDALAEATMSDPDAEGGRLAKALAAIRKLVWRDLPDAAKKIITPPEFETALAAAIRERARMYEQKWPGVELTPTALASNWTRVTQRQGDGKFTKKGGLTPAAILAMGKREE